MIFPGLYLEREYQGAVVMGGCKWFQEGREVTIVYLIFMILKQPFKYKYYLEYCTIKNVQLSFVNWILYNARKYLYFVVLSYIYHRAPMNDDHPSVYNLFTNYLNIYYTMKLSYLDIKISFKVIHVHIIYLCM